MQNIRKFQLVKVDIRPTSRRVLLFVLLKSFKVGHLDYNINRQKVCCLKRKILSLVYMYSYIFGSLELQSPTVNQQDIAEPEFLYIFLVAIFRNNIFYFSYLVNMTSKKVLQKKLLRFLLNFAVFQFLSVFLQLVDEIRFSGFDEKLHLRRTSLYRSHVTVELLLSNRAVARVDQSLCGSLLKN